MCKLTKNFPIQGGVEFSGFRVKFLTRGRGKIQDGRGLRPPSRRIYALGHLKKSGHILCTHS